MKRCVGLTVAMFLAISGSADALSISSFTAHATSSAVSYKIHFCDGAARLHEHFDFFALDRPSGHFNDDASGRVPKGCYVGSGHFANRYLSGLWELKLTMSDSRGALVRRSARVFLP